MINIDINHARTLFHSRSSRARLPASLSDIPEFAELSGVAGPLSLSVKCIATDGTPSGGRGKRGGNTDSIGCAAKSAGDACHGAFTYGLMQQWPVDDLFCFASAVAALNCRQLGGRSGLPTLSEVEDFLTDQRKAWEAGIKRNK